MSDRLKGVLGRWNATGLEIRDAMEEAVHNALRDHKRNGRPVVVWDRANDHIVILRADQIEIPDEGSVGEPASGDRTTTVK